MRNGGSFSINNLVFIFNSSVKQFEEECSQEQTNQTLPPEKLSKIFQFINFMKSQCCVGEMFGVEDWHDVEFLVCHSERRTPGLATEIIRTGVRILKERGVKVSEPKLFLQHFNICC